MNNQDLTHMLLTTLKEKQELQRELTSTEYSKMTFYRMFKDEEKRRIEAEQLVEDFREELEKYKKLTLIDEDDAVGRTD